ncbi:MAG: aldehyde dehydrogenase family protein, partial [Kordiimonadaceae bacterium]|nr:aldehyde dehydrogenase family protein [Kordiimonadaceae bacterium]
LDAGAQAVTGGGVHPRGKNYFEPTILVDAKNDMEIAQAEIFGPVAVLYSFKTEEEVIQLANDTPYGLAAYCYTRDMARCWRMSEALEYGMVAINEGVVASEAAPFGGVKQSGIGREGSKYGLDDFTEIKCVSMAGIGS